MKQWKAQCSGDVSQAFKPHIDVLEVYKKYEAKTKMDNGWDMSPFFKKKKEKL